MTEKTVKEYYQLRDVPIMVYKPAVLCGKESTAVILMHSDSNYFETAQAYAIAEKGYYCFVSNSTKRANNLDKKILQLAEVVRFAKKYPGVEKTVLFGHSGGATLMTAYQAIAENGADMFRQGKHIIDIDDVGDLPAADGVMLIDANFGNGVMTLLSLDPSIVDEDHPLSKDESLNLLNPENGYDPNGNFNYSEEFIGRFLRAQGQRMNRLIRHAQERVRAIERKEGTFTDDEPMVIAGAEQIAPLNKLFPQVISYFSHTSKRWPLIHQDDSVTEEIVHCVRDVRMPKNWSGSLHSGALQTTVRNFLKSSAVVTTEEYGYDETTLYGVDWTSSYCVTVGNASYISVPMLLMGLTGSYEYIAAEHVYRQAVRCKDKTVAFVEGAGHNFKAEKEEYGDTVSSCFNYVDKWLQSRFSG